MIPANVSPILDHLWQSTAFAGLMAAVAFGLRKNRAAVRFWLWLAASLKFLVPFALLVELGRLISWRPAPTIFQPAQWTAIQDVGQTVFTPSSAITLTPGTAIHASSMWWAWLAGLWAVGTLFVAVRWARQWWGVRALVRRAAPVDLGLAIPTVTAPATLEPGVFGVFRPVLFLPGGITERMTPEQMRALVEHELCHVRRRDNLWAALHVAVEAIFWFHPVVWWLGAKMVEEREACCDEAVLRAGAAADVYASSVLEVCRFYAAPPTPAISGITGADLKNRVLAIASGDFGRKLSPASRLLLFGLGCSLLAAPVSAGLLLKSSPVSARSTAPAEVGPPPPPQTQGTPAPAAASGVDVTWTRISSAEYSVRIGVTLPGSEFVQARQTGNENAQFDFIGEVKDASGTTVTNLRSAETFKIAGDDAVDPAHVPVFDFNDIRLLPGAYTLKVLARDNVTGRIGTYIKQFTIQAPPVPAKAPRFAVVSIKQSAAGGNGPFNTQEDMRNGGIQPHGVYRINHWPLANLFIAAYKDDLVYFYDGYLNTAHQIIGLPDWAQVRGTLFDIEAKPDAEFPDLPEVENVAQVRLMLQAMLADRFHLVMHRENDVFDGYRMEVAPGGPKNLTPGSLNADGMAVDPRFGSRTFLPDGMETAFSQMGGPDISMKALAQRLTADPFGAPVIDGTGIQGRYSIYMEWDPSEDPPVPGPHDFTDARKQIVKTLLEKQYGLLLAPAEIPLPVFVVDSVSLPTPN